MFSYLEAISKVVNDTIYGRGIKIYMENKVLNHEELILDYWREYTVLGKNHYSVKIPIIHLALDNQKFDKAGQALEQITSCTCAYFEEYGPCKHIVAVCTGLEEEFGFQLKAKKEKQKDQESRNILDTIFEAEKEKYTRSFLASLDEYLASSKIFNFWWLENFAAKVANKPEDYKKFLKDLQTKLKKDLQNYDLERKVVKLIEKTLIFGSNWWNFWQPLFKSLSKHRHLDLLANIWILKLQKGSFDFEEEYIFEVLNLSLTNRQDVLEKIKQELAYHPKLWIEFAFKAELWDWLFEKVDALEPDVLVKLALNHPDKREDLETTISRKMKIWSDFLSGEQYEEVANTFQIWQNELGRSDVFEDCLSYFEKSHHRKKKFLKMLSEINKI